MTAHAAAAARRVMVRKDEERDALAMGDRDPARADAVLRRRVAMLRARLDARLGAIRVGEGPDADEREKRLRRRG